MTIPPKCDDFWYSPMYAIFRANHVLKEKPDRETKKKINELIPVAISCLGQYQETGIQHYLQPTKETEQSPDYRVIFANATNGTVQTHVLDIEVVEYEEHSEGEDVGEFILRTKLENPKKAYPDYCAFICFLNAKLTATWQDIQTTLSSSSKPNCVYIIGRTRPDRGIYTFLQVHPGAANYVEIDTHSHNLNYKPLILYTGSGPRPKVEDIPELFA